MAKSANRRNTALKEAMTKARILAHCPNPRGIKRRKWP